MRSEEFLIQDDQLLRAVLPRRGEPYVHRCELGAFKDVCHTIDDLKQSFTGEELVEATGLPSTQVFTALAFLKERGCVEPWARKTHIAATNDTYLDAMIEWTAAA